VIILSDLLFNHREHPTMLQTCKSSLAPGGQVFVIFSSHRPWLAEKDKVRHCTKKPFILVGMHALKPLFSCCCCCCQNFFNVAAAEPFGFVVEDLFVGRMDPMFPNDPGDAEVRSTIYGHQLTLPTN